MSNVAPSDNSRRAPQSVNAAALVGPDEFFSEEQLSRLNGLMQRWRESIVGNARSLSPDERTELESLIDAEVIASGRRAASRT